MTVTGLLHVGLTVPSLDEAVDYYSAFGLENVVHDDAVAMRCLGREQDQVVLTEGGDKRVSHISFSFSPDGIPDLRRKLAERGISETDPAPGVPGDGLWFRDPEGVLVNVRTDQPAAPQLVTPTPMNLAGRYDRDVNDARWEQVLSLPQVRPRRMGHVILFSADIAAAEQFYIDVLGFRFSDRTPGKVTFLNCGPGDHHIFGFAQSTHSGLNHASFEVANIDEMAVGAQRMVDRGYTTGWGLGRHTMGSNLFHYVRDPWGSWVEYFSDIDQIGEDWQGHDCEVPPAVWGPQMPREFAQNHEALPLGLAR